MNDIEKSYIQYVIFVICFIIGVGIVSLFYLKNERDNLVETLKNPTPANCAMMYYDNKNSIDIIAILDGACKKQGGKEK